MMTHNFHLTPVGRESCVQVLADISQSFRLLNVYTAYMLAKSAILICDAQLSFPPLYLSVANISFSLNFLENYTKTDFLV